MKDREVVFVSGASRGIGRAIALAFGACGYRVVVNYLKSEAAARAVAESIISEGGEAMLLRADVSDYSALKEAVATVYQYWGKVDILVNNAGISESKLFADISPEIWQNMMNVNLNSVYNCTHLMLPKMIEQQYGRIINISSIWGVSGAAMEVHYSTAKAAIIGFTKALAKEVAPSNITVNCIAPGVIDTDMLSDYTAEDIRALIDQTPACRLGTPADIAAAALFFAQKSSSFITAQTLTIDGAFS